MRDLLNLLDNMLVEASLAAGQIPSKKMSAVVNPKTKTLFTRPELFLHKVKTGSPFTKVDGDEVVINRGDVNLVASWLASGPTGTITMRTTDGGTVKNTELQKTVEFGSKESENIKIKPSDVFATDPKTRALSALCAKTISRISERCAARACEGFILLVTC